MEMSYLNLINNANIVQVYTITAELKVVEVVELVANCWHVFLFLSGAMLTCTDTVPSLSVNEEFNTSTVARNGCGQQHQSNAGGHAGGTRSHASSQVSIPGLDWDEQVT